MEPNTEGNLLEVMDLARTLRQEQLFIQQEQAAFARLTETLTENSTSITRLAYICAQQRQNLNDLIVSRPETGPIVCCRRANNYENANFVDAKKVMEYEYTLAYEELFNHLYRSPYILALSLATGDRLTTITPQHMSSVIHTVSTGIYGNAINTKDVEMVLKLLRELIEIQIVVSDNPRRLLRANSSAFARLYHRLNESMFSAKIFLTVALFEPIMGVLSVSDTILDVNPHKVVQSFSSKERFRRFGAETAQDYQQNVDKFHRETITKLHAIVVTFIESLTRNWSVFPSTLRWLVQTMCHQLKQTPFSEQIINEIITDMVFTHFICPAIVSPDIIGIIDAPISEQVRYNLIQIGQIIQTLALAKHDTFDVKYAKLHAKFNTNLVANLIDMLLVSQTGEDVVAILSQQSDFERTHLLSTQNELAYFVEFFRILTATDEYEVSLDERQKLRKILGHLPQTHLQLQPNIETGAAAGAAGTNDAQAKERSKQSFISLGKATKSKIAKSISFSTNGGGAAAALETATSNNNNNSTNANNGLPNGSLPTMGQAPFNNSNENQQTLNNGASQTPASSTNSSPIRTLPIENSENEPILVFNLYNSDEHKLQPLTEEEVLKMNSIGQEMTNGEALLDAGAESVNLENTIDKSSVANGFDGIDGLSDVHRPLHTKAKRFSMSHDDASIGNSDNLEAVSEAPSNHSVTSSLELEENDQNDNLSDMVSANVSGRGSPNISGRDTPSSQVTDGESVHNALPTPQMQKLISKARSDIEDKFCKFELKKFEGDETVSIISDTWSTDVLASDSETLDASDRERERERDRNFSTPLIPSAVVLPGDNNFGAMNGTGGGVSVVRPNYIDAFDQRSESNWSTDVLASDSEKLAEVDTDDNLSITAKSDITDAGVRSEQERDLLAAAISAPNPEQPQRTPDSPYYVSHGGRSFRVANSDRVAGSGGGGGGGGGLDAIVAACGELGHGSGASSGGNASDHSQEDSAFFDAVNLYEDAAAAAAVASGNSGTANELLTSAATLHHYHGLSSLARSSVRTTNQYSGENSFQQNYKSGSSDGSKEAFLATSHMRRQTSAESSISNQSLNLDETAATAEKPPKPYHKAAIKKRKHGGNNINETKDLIDFSDFGVEERKPVIKGSIPTNQFDTPITSTALLDIFGGSDDAVEHRRISIDQRSAVFDGRRNGIMAVKDGATPSLRRHQSLNYENHEIMLNVTIPTRISALPNLQENLSQTDDDKSQQEQQEMILCARTEALHLNDDNENSNNNNNADGEGVITLETAHAASAALRMPSSITVGNSASVSCQKPTKYTGAIPKSISFDASADKSSTANTSISTRTTHRPQRTLHDGPLRHGGGGGGSSGATAANSSLFNKLKHGFFKNRRGNKSHRHTVVTPQPTNDDFTQSHNRSVSFSVSHDNDIALDMQQFAGGNEVVAVPYADISEDILAKYRRKVSTSSEATNSDSTGGNNGLGNRKNSDVEAKSPNTLLHDKAIAFNIVKRKVRTVLSKTNLHTGDFRHTTYSNTSPLLTYLQIQLAQALNLQHFQQIAYVSEAIRCIGTLESSQHAQLLEELQTDIQKRQNYLQYLMRYRQHLLLVMENVQQFETRLRSESATCNRYLMAVCVRLFIEKRETKIEAFQEEFACLNVSDDKIDLIEDFIEGLVMEFITSGGLPYVMPECQALEARTSIERIVLHRMYQQVMFPNDDADVSRDTVLSEHISKLQAVIRPSHPALCIPVEYLAESPWPFAQQQLFYISAFKTPREKLQCVIRCITSIMNLLHMSSGRAPSADDLLPVLIYVVIMANPPFLLSTIEYISCFIGEKLDGEEQFHWTLFGSVVKFIKTMDYLD